MNNPDDATNGGAALPQKKRLARTSDEILRQIDDLRATEIAKRQHPISTPEFHRLANSVERQSRAVFRTAAEESDLGDAIPTGDVSIEEVEPAARGELPS